MPMLNININEIFRNDVVASELMVKAINYCIYDGKYTSSAKFLAKLLLNKINSSKHPNVDLNYFHGGADEYTREMALGIIAVRHHPLEYFKPETGDKILKDLEDFYSQKK